jgi:hypothetical protein
MLEHYFPEITSFLPSTLSRRATPDLVEAIFHALICKTAHIPLTVGRAITLEWATITAIGRRNTTAIDEFDPGALGYRFSMKFWSRVLPASALLAWQLKLAP